MSDAEIELRRKDLDPNPFKQFAKWYEAAEAAHPKLPNSMTLATATRDGRPSARMVLLKGFDEDGFVFFTNYESQKGRELEENPRASLVFYWSALDRQVRIDGTVAKTSRKESEEYFQTRPADSRLSAWASKQSSPVASRQVLEDEMKRLTSSRSISSTSSSTSIESSPRPSPNSDMRIADLVHGDRQPEAFDDGTFDLFFQCIGRAAHVPSILQEATVNPYDLPGDIARRP